MENYRTFKSKSGITYTVDKEVIEVAKEIQNDDFVYGHQITGKRKGTIRWFHLKNMKEVV